MISSLSAESIEDPWCVSTNPRIIEFPDVKKAQEFITPGIVVTPCFYSRLSQIADMEIYLKLEIFQATGSFKERGARNALMMLDEVQKRNGVVAASLGNHSQAISYHGMKLGIPVTVVMPVMASMVKVQKCISYKANVILKGNTMAEARQIAKDLAKQSGLTFINGYDHPHVIAGQGVIGIEILDQLRHIDAVVVPVGGGDLIAGIAVAVKHLSPNTEIIGVEPEKYPSFSEAYKRGKPKVSTLDKTSNEIPVGYNSFATAKGRMNHLLTVSDELLDVAVLYMLENEKLVTQTSGAAAVAAVFSGKLNHLRGKRIVLIVSGGNIDTSVLGSVVERALGHLGRYIQFSVDITDRPNAISELTADINKLGVNIKHVLCGKAWIENENYLVNVKLLCETRDIENAVELKRFIEKKYSKTDFKDFPNVSSAKALMNIQH